MTAHKRIFLNIVATYGRSLYALALGLFTARWALQALGQVDYGLYGLVGGLTAFVAFFNGLLSSAVGRFFGVAVGAMHKEGNAEEGLEDCRKWFNTALSLHIVVPLVLIVIGYPIGEWAVGNFLSIPSDRIEACRWVWRFTCISCFVGMVNIPFQAMYTAKQEIAELTIYGVVQSTATAVFLYFMITHPRVWITKYAFMMMLIGVLPQLIIAYRALAKYEECKIVREYLLSWQRTKEIVNFACARFWTALSTVVSGQGNAILVNKYLGPALNASMTIGNTVASQAATLSGSLSGAFWPVIANKAGEGDLDGVRNFSFQTCRLGSILVLIFAIPLALEVDEVMVLWLKTPPEYVSLLCVTILADIVLERISEGYWMAIMGVGKGIGLYSGWASTIGFARLAIAWLAFALGYGIYGLCVALIVARFWAIVVRLVLGRKLVGMSMCYWLGKVFAPIAMASAATIFIGYWGRLIMAASFLRVCTTTLICEMVFLPMIWFVVFSDAEREFILTRCIKHNRK